MTKTESMNFQEKIFLDFREVSSPCPRGHLRIGLVVLLLLTIAACSKDKSGPKETEKGKPEDYAALAATYVLEPSSSQERVILRADKGVQYLDGGRETLGRFVLDEKSMRIYMEKDEGRATGIFLYGSYDKNSFRGKWDGEIRTLRRAGTGGPARP